MSAKRISELIAGVPPYADGALFEISVPNPGAPSGYDSRKALLSDIAATVGDGLVISDGELSGDTTLPGGGVVAGTGWIGIEQGAPQAPLHIGSNLETAVNTSIFLNYDWTEAAIPGEDAHGVTDTTRYGVTGTNDGAYASYDDRSAFYGTANFNHHRSIQIRPVYEITGTLTSHMGCYAAGTVMPGASVTNWVHYFAQDALGGGTVTNNWGINIQSMQKGSAVNIGAQIAMPAFATQNVGLLIGGPGGGSAENYGFLINSGSTAVSRINSRLGFDTDPVAVLDMNRSVSSAAWGTAGINIRTRNSATFTDTTSSGTVAEVSINTISNAPIAATNATTYTDASTLRISGVPQVGSNVTYTNTWALRVNSGSSYFGGNILLNTGLLMQFGGKTSTFPALRRGGTTAILQARTADDAAYTPFEASTVRTTATLTVASLNSTFPPGTAGRRAMVTDATVATFGGVAAGGGANTMPVFDDGVAWRIG